MAVTNLVPYLHVRDLDDSVAFYGRLGFEPVATVGGRGQAQWWCHLMSGEAELMLAAASEPIDADQQATLLYMYSDDLTGLHRRLEQAGLGCTLSQPAHMPEGELRLADPDGYVVLIGRRSSS